MSQTKFFTSGVPMSLSSVNAPLITPISFEQVASFMRHCNAIVVRVPDDSMERAGVMNGGYVAVDFTHFPAPPQDGKEDACLCYAVHPGEGRPTVTVKAYCGLWGTCPVLGTRYDLSKGKHSINCGMDAMYIFGAVFASWDACGRLLWERDPASFPEQMEVRVIQRIVWCLEPVNREEGSR